MTALRAVAVIAEYVPFHNGHLWQLRQAQRLTQANVTVAIMSGNWTQRGEPAVFDKWTRTKMALANGVDLVIELPAVSAVQPAHLFAQRAVELVQALQCDDLSFGSEHPDWDFNQLAQLDVQATGQEFQDHHLNFPTAFRQALLREYGLALQEPNDTLGFWYAQAAGQFPHPVHLVPVKRQGSGHRDQHLGQTISSGTAIRRALLAGDLDYRTSVPDATKQAWAGLTPLDWEQFWPYLKYAITQQTPAELRQIYQMTEGLEYRLQRLAPSAPSFANFLAAVKTKRYTYPRLQRLCTYILLNFQDPAVRAYQPVLRVLGMTTRGQQYLHTVKKHLELPLITTASKTALNQGLALEARAGLVTELVNGRVQDRGRSVIRKPAIKE
ncbi:nucleotidyltransferase [Fructilactobacillus ixorae]|uniref:tRNA(Met) cytidine acetate ligase n=1 Tax=Fructilactobacillus ixorae TaxID=1750535 RepID=A0ABY5C727_9LACO|nr:nucleotidyltransferase [Fructilactobacillus ixorae]USS93839.1 nucleotidyltransferase [Fructilactobacillus ixorae]